MLSWLDTAAAHQSQRPLPVGRGWALKQQWLQEVMTERAEEAMEGLRAPLLSAGCKTFVVNLGRFPESVFKQMLNLTS